MPVSSVLMPVILGPTACGKTALSLSVAEHFGCEIISADSMQIYCGMDIGTAKLPPGERRGIPHHLIDIIPPAQPFSVADFRTLAIQTAEEIIGRQKLPLLVGGTGLYIDSLFNSYNFSAHAGVDRGLRQKLQAEYAADQGLTLHRKLRSVDPEAAARVHPHDAHRLIRALEVYYATGSTISSLRRQAMPAPRYRPLMIGLNMEREALYHRIELRVEQMLADGLVAEVAALLGSGLSRDANSMQGLGYRQIAAYLAGECTLPEAVERIKRDTRRYAKRQLTWFKRDARINWFYPGHYREETELSQAVCALISSRMKEESQ